MANEKQTNPADNVHEEPGHSTISPQPINWHDSCNIPPRAVTKRVENNSRELSANDFDIDTEKA